MQVLTRLAVNPLQWMATPDGWIDPTSAPPRRTRYAELVRRGFRHVHVEPADTTDPTAFLADLEATGMAVGTGICGADWSPDAAERDTSVETARRTAAAYAQVGVEVVFLAAAMSATHPRVLRAAVGAEPDVDRLEAFTDLYGHVARAMRSEGVRPALHPHVGTWIETEAETRHVLDGVGEPLGFGPDTGHLAWTGADPVALMSDYRDRIAGVHLKDYDVASAAAGRAAGEDYRTTVVRGLWREPGFGDLDVDAALDLLAPDCWVVVEVDRPWAPTPEESLDRCAEWARPRQAPRA